MLERKVEREKERVCDNLTRGKTWITFLILRSVVDINDRQWESEKMLENVNKIYLVAIVPIS